MSARVSRWARATVGLLALVALTYLWLVRPPANPPDGRPWEAPDAARQASLEDHWEDAARRVEGRQRVVREVIAGRLSLAEAAARFQELDLASESFNWERFRVGVPGASDEEKQRHAVIGHVKSLLVNDPDQARAVTHRLEAELQAFREKHDTQESPQALGAAAQPRDPQPVAGSAR